MFKRKIGALVLDLTAECYEPKLSNKKEMIYGIKNERISQRTNLREILHKTKTLVYSLTRHEKTSWCCICANSWNNMI